MEYPTMGIANNERTSHHVESPHCGMFLFFLNSRNVLFFLSHNLTHSWNSLAQSYLAAVLRAEEQDKLYSSLANSYIVLKINVSAQQTQNLYAIFTMLDQWWRRGTDVVQMLNKCFVFA